MSDYSQILYGFNVLYLPKDIDRFGNDIEPKSDFDKFSGMEFAPPFENKTIEAYCTFIGSDYFPNAAGISKVSIQDFSEELKYSNRPNSGVINCVDARDIPIGLTFTPKVGIKVLIDIINIKDDIYSVQIDNNEICKLQIDKNNFGHVDFNMDNINKYFECSELFYDGISHDTIDIENNPNREENLKTITDIMFDNNIDTNTPNEEQDKADVQERHKGFFSKLKDHDLFERDDGWDDYIENEYARHAHHVMEDFTDNGLVDGSR